MIFTLLSKTIFFTMLLIQLLTVAHVAINMLQHFKKSMKNLKLGNQHIVYLERKVDGTTKSPFTPNIYIRSMN